MGDGNRTAGEFDRLESRAFGRMAHIDDKSDTVHLGNNSAAHAGQASVIFLIAACRQKRLVVVGQLHEPCAERVTDLDKADVVLDRRRVLETEKDGGASLAAGAAYILTGTALENQLGKPFKPAVPRLNIGDSLTEILVIGDGDMHRIDAALTHLPEDLFRPVAILKTVDHMHGCTYDTGPDEI